MWWNFMSFSDGKGNRVDDELWTNGEYLLSLEDNWLMPVRFIIDQPIRMVFNMKSHHILPS